MSRRCRASPALEKLSKEVKRRQPRRPLVPMLDVECRFGQISISLNF